MLDGVDLPIAHMTKDLPREFRTELTSDQTGTAIAAAPPSTPRRTLRRLNLRFMMLLLQLT